MAKFVQIIFVVFLVITVCFGEGPQSRTSRFQVKRNRFLARQEASESAAVTPYPSADELKPEVPFDEATAIEEQPIQPDEIYGPPNEEAAIETGHVAAAAAEEPSIAAAEESAIANEEAAGPARLTARHTSSVRKSSARPIKLRKAAPAPARLQLQPKFVPQPVFYYVA